MKVLMKKVILFVALASILILMNSCGTSKKVPTGPNVRVTDTGLVAEGSNVSFIERGTRDQAIRFARYEMVKYINLVLGVMDKDYKLPSGTHTEETLKNSKVVDVKLYDLQDGSIEAVCQIGLAWDDVQKWADAYYENLPAEDAFKTAGQKKYNEKIMKYLRSFGRK